LGGNASDSKHGKAAVLELLGFDHGLLSWVIGEPAKGVPSVVSRDGVSAKGGSSVKASGLRAGLPELEDGPCLDECAAKDEELLLCCWCDERMR